MDGKFPDQFMSDCDEHPFENCRSGKKRPHPIICVASMVITCFWLWMPKSDASPEQQTQSDRLLRLKGITTSDGPRNQEFNHGHKKDENWSLEIVNYGEVSLLWVQIRCNELLKIEFVNEFFLCHFCTYITI